MNDESQEKTLLYYINLPVNDAVFVADRLEQEIWEIASEEDVEDILRKAQFNICISEPALDLGVLMSVVVVWMADKVFEKATDKVLERTFDRLEEVWREKILPKLRERFGNSALAEEEEDKENE